MLASVFSKPKKIEESGKFSEAGLAFEYTVKYSKRTSIEIRVRKNGQILVAAPLSTRKAGVNKFLKERSAWIMEKLQMQADNLHIHAPKKFESGEEIYFLGKKYELIIKKDIIADVELGEKELIVSRPTNNSAKVKAQLKSWYKLQAQEVFNERLSECLKLAAGIGVHKASGISFRRMNRRWGTCTHDNKIILNSNLIFLDLEYIDYVILHELCHFKQKNHSPKYYALLSSVCPNYKDIRKRLNQHEIEGF